MLAVGNKVVYPSQGPCLIGRIVDRIVNGRPVMFYHLIVLDEGGGEVFVPVDKAHAIGVRSLLERSEIRKLLEQLKKSDRPGTNEAHQTNWAHRANGMNRSINRSIKNSRMLASGSAFDLVEVVESLTELKERKALTPGESQALERARRLLICEISEVIGETKRAAEEELDRALAALKEELRNRLTAVRASPNARRQNRGHKGDFGRMRSNGDA